MSRKPLSRDAFAEVVRNTPLVSIDLIVRDPDRQVLLGLRRNRPAQGTWFVPGGVICKDERFDEAFARIADAELGLRSHLDDAQFLGPYQHFYPDNFADMPGFGTHYVVLAWMLPLAQRPQALPDAQHRSYRWVSLQELARDESIHLNSRIYATHRLLQPERGDA